MQATRKNFTLKTIAGALSLAVIAMTVVAQSCFALTANTPYTVEMTKVNANGSTTLVSTSAVTSDANGKIIFTFANVPTQATNNFLIVTVKDSAGNVRIKSFAPAPPANASNTLGVNTTTTAQAKLMEKMGLIVGSDDPIVIAFGLMFTRNPNLSTTDISNAATIGKEAIINGMEVYMRANGASAAQLAAFKKKLVYNPTSGAKDLRNFAALAKSSVDTPASAKADMAKASGLISDIFIDAASATGIDLDLILAAFDSAGIKLQSGAGLSAMNALSVAFRNNMNQSVNNFFTRVSATKVKSRYAATLTALNASTAQKTRFNNGVTTMMNAMAAIDTTYAPYFDGTANMTETINTAHAAGRIDKTQNPIAAAITAWNNAGSPAINSAGFIQGTMLDPVNSTIQNAIDLSFQSAFSTFNVAIQSTNTEITALRAAVATALGITTAQLPVNLGTLTNFNGAVFNWPVPQAAAVSFVASIISGGGGLTYTRSGLAIPNSMAEWFGSCANGTSFNRTACTGAGSTWTVNTATAFNTGNASFDALLGIQEDIQIAEQTRFDIFSGGAQPSMQQMQTAKQAFMTNLGTIVGNIGGTTDGATALSALQKKALVKSQQQPSLH